MQMELQKIKKNKTWDFLLPLVGIPLPDYFSLYNVYLFDSEHNVDKYNLFVCFKWHGHKKFEDSLNIIRHNPQYRGEFSYQDGNYIVFILELLEEFKSEYDLFLEGKYSKFSDKAKEIICRHRSSDSIIKSILNKCNSLKEMWEKDLNIVISDSSELWSIYDRCEETLDNTCLEIIEMKSKYSVY